MVILIGFDVKFVTTIFLFNKFFELKPDNEKKLIFLFLQNFAALIIFFEFPEALNKMIKSSLSA